MYLNLVGLVVILWGVVWCWVLLFSEWVVVYCLCNGFDHCKIDMVVVVQWMVVFVAVGMFFMVDFVIFNWMVVLVEVIFGFGEVFVFGLVSFDVYKV